MMTKAQNSISVKKEPLFHVSKNTVLPFWQKSAFLSGGVLAALIIIALISVLLIKQNPFKIFSAIVKGPFLDLWSYLQSAAMLLGFAIAVVPAFKMKYFNMGANGAVLMSCAAAIVCMKYLPKVNIGGSAMPNWLIMIIMTVAGIIMATLYSLIPAIFKAFFDINETLFTLMSNYIAAKFCGYLIYIMDESKSGVLNIVNRISHKGWFPKVGGNNYLLSIIVVLIMTAFMAVYMKYTKHGFESSLVGESVNTARYVGINDKKVMLRTIALSGALCGILGVLYAGSISHTLTESIGGLGFTAILVAWLANFSPLIMVAVAFLVQFLQTGTNYVATSLSLGSTDFSSICVGIMFFCVIAAQFFIEYKVELTSRGREFFHIKGNVKTVEGGIH